MKYLLDSDPQRERARQLRIMAVAERQFARRFQAEIIKVTEYMVGEFRRTGSAPALPPDHIRRVEAVFHDMIGVVVQAFGERILGQGKSLGIPLERKAGWDEFWQRLALEYLAQEAIRRRIAQISESARRNIIDAIIRGQQAGESVDAIAGRILEQLPGMSRLRGHVIARTETHGASQYASHNAAKATGMNMRKEWVSVSDPRTRDFGESDGDVDEFNHRAMNGVTVPMDDLFQVPDKFGGTEGLLFPGDPNGSAGNVIMCRCVSVQLVTATTF